MLEGSAYMLAVCVGLNAVILVGSGVDHTVRFDSFRRAIELHGVVGASLVRIFGFAVPLTELLVGASCAVSLIGFGNAEVALSASAGIFAVFAAYSYLVVRSGRGDVPCGCGGPATPMSTWVTARALILLASSLAGLMLAGSDAAFSQLSSTSAWFAVLATVGIAIPVWLMPATSDAPAGLGGGRGTQWISS
jgi:hypothetical protein